MSATARGLFELITAPLFAVVYIASGVFYAIRGRRRFDRNEYEAAIEDFSRFIELKFNSAGAYASRGVALEYLGRHDEALADFDAAHALRPRAWVLAHRGAVRRELGDVEGAVADFDEAIRLDPAEAAAYFHRGAIRRESDDWDGAIADFDAALRLRPDDGEVLYRRAETRDRRGESDLALDDLNACLQLKPDSESALRVRAKLLLERGEFELAAADQTQADDLRDQSPEPAMLNTSKKLISKMLAEHFAPTATDDIAVRERQFPNRVRADLQRAIDKLVAEQARLLHFCGVRKSRSFEGVNFSDLLIYDRDDPALAVPPQYEELDIGNDEIVRCIKDGLWLLARNNHKFALYLEPPSMYTRRQGIRFQLAVPNDPAGSEFADRFFRELEKSVNESSCYRGKILSLTERESYSGTSIGVNVHRLKTVTRDQVILPKKTLELLERNVTGFIAHRAKLHALGMPLKKGLLFYGPPGTGKSHTIHYLAGALQGHTTLLISAEQVAHLDEYLALARLLQPSIVVLEDVDLIARDRTAMNSPCEEVMLNKLLNEMDGLQPDAEILFLLTTNRPEALEGALASRPGRIDQAIEFPLPDDLGREKLVRLYARGVTVPDDVVAATVRKSSGASAAFIKELMRRAIQFRLERGDSTTIDLQDVDAAVEELVFSGGALNRKLLGAGKERRAGFEGN